MRKRTHKARHLDAAKKAPKKAVKIPSVATIERRYRELRRLRERLIETEALQNNN